MNHYLEGKYFHTFVNSVMQQLGRINKVLEDNVAVCTLLSMETFEPTAEVLINLKDYTSPNKWIQFYDNEVDMRSGHTQLKNSGRW